MSKSDFHKNLRILNSSSSNNCQNTLDHEHNESRIYNWFEYVQCVCRISRLHPDHRVQLSFRPLFQYLWRTSLPIHPEHVDPIIILCL